MSLRTTTEEIDRMVTAVEVQEAVDKVVAYIRKTQHFHTDGAAHAYWAALFEDEKVEVLRQALS